MRIELSKSEFWNAISVGVMRQCSSLKKGLKHAHGANEKDDLNGWSMHIEGACGEAAVAKALNVYWAGTVDTFKFGADIGEKIQVRTRSKDYYDLIVRSDDKDDDIFVLVTGRAPTFNVVGWILGRDAKKPQWVQNYGNRVPAWFVPQKNLIDIQSLHDNLG